MKKTTLIDRRTFVLGGAAVLGSAVLAGCAGPQADSAPQQQASEPAAPVQDQPESQQVEPQESVPEAASATSDTLLVFFSRAGMNYASSGPVHTDIGNTAVVAGFIEEALGSDTYEIVATDPYPYEYEATTDLAMQEQQASARPAIAGELPDLSSYTTILVGSGVWWGNPPMIMHTFFEAVDTTGKTIVPFTTHAGSGLGSAVQTYRELCPNATVETNGLAVSGENAAGSREEVQAWLSELGLA